MLCGARPFQRHDTSRPESHEAADVAAAGTPAGLTGVGLPRGRASPPPLIGRPAVVVPPQSLWDRSPDREPAMVCGRPRGARREEPVGTATLDIRAYCTWTSRVTKYRSSPGRCLPPCADTLEWR